MLSVTHPNLLSHPSPPPQLTNAEAARLLLDQEDWRFRPPPWGLGPEGYELCPRVVAGVPCRLGEQCSHAHSPEELNEWQLRSNFRQKAIQASSSDRSYSNDLMQKLAQVENVDDILKEELDYAQVRISPDVQIVYASRDDVHHWAITVTSKVAIHWIALIDESSHSEFSLSSVSCRGANGRKDHALPIRCQEWQNPRRPVKQPAAGGETAYAVKLSFVSCVFGTFTQGIVFDFGRHPLLVRRIKVEVVPDPTAVEKAEQEEVLVCKDLRWDQRNSVTMLFKPSIHCLSPEDELLAARYPPPSTQVSAKANILSHPLCAETYRQRLHLLLNAEEWDQRELLSKFNFETELQLVESYWLTGLVTTAKFCIPGELFAQLNLHRRLTEDTAAGRIILTGCTTVLLSPCKNPAVFRGKRKVYEALIEGKCKDIVYLRLAGGCVADLNLKPNTDLKVEIQFQLDRLQLCELHHAVDALPDVSIVFPRMDEVPNISWVSQNLPGSNSLDPRLNAKQKEAIMWLMAPFNIHLPPILLMGPYGTGKTFTLSQGIKNLLLHTNARILICTHSNSAADLYVKDYLHQYVESGMEEATPLRVYYKHRRVETVHPIVLKYCILESEGSARVFCKPTVETVTERRVIIATLATSRCLTELDLPKGYFTHVILDEAAQIMECEAILPFALVSSSTRIILAGDHMQLSPEVHSPLARHHGLQVSLLERLYDAYPSGHPCAVLLRENYRSHPAIVQFTSQLFYQNQLLATTQLPAHPTVYPLSFFTAKGHEIQDSNSTAYYNNAEVYEVVERVIELKTNWPKSWGPMDDSSIGVVSPYADQVFQLRAALRQRKLGNISVERVLNIQGKQFRMIILSTVRTRHTCSGREDRFFNKTPASKPQQKPVFLDEEEQDFGFLSNAKLLITAITRAQSVVAVVGDPIALCSIGKCRKLWEHYLQVCHKNDSLQGTTYRTICVELGNLEVGISSSLDPKAPVFIPRGGGMVPADGRPSQLSAVAGFPPRPPHPPAMPFPIMMPMVAAPGSASAFKMSGGSVVPPRGFGSPMDPAARFQMLVESQANGMRLPPHVLAAAAAAAAAAGEDRKLEDEAAESLVLRMNRLNGSVFNHGPPEGEMLSRGHLGDGGRSGMELGGGVQLGGGVRGGVELVGGQGGGGVGLGLGMADGLVLRRMSIGEQQHQRHNPHPAAFLPNGLRPAPLPYMTAEELERRLLRTNDPSSAARLAAAARLELDIQQQQQHQHGMRLLNRIQAMEAAAAIHNGSDYEAAQQGQLTRTGREGGRAPDPSGSSQCLLSYAEAVRTSSAQASASPLSVVADFEQRVAPRTSNGLYRYF